LDTSPDIQKVPQPQPQPRVRRSNETRSAEMRAALIEAAIRSLCAIGYSKTTTHEICRRAGATSGAIQHHFGSKDELILATLERLRVEMEERFERLNRLEGSLEDRCGAMVREMWHTFYGRERYMAVWEIAIGSRGEKAFYERVLEQRFNTLRMCEQVWRKTFAISPKGPRQHLDAMHVVLSFLRGLVLYSELDADAAFIEAQLAVMTTALIGILKSKPNKTGRTRQQPRRRS
jgi:AcrR family transcriptional regulator